jgi:hypothetical protein
MEGNSSNATLTEAPRRLVHCAENPSLFPDKLSSENPTSAAARMDLKILEVLCGLAMFVS